ncbi:adenosine deaminase-like protein [Octopus sinensis]|uniref:Adenosine deaminase-like protein n=1 Tax=Octopus sinensis TaxID=2607531 RepID=A0A6P7T112_9MOLL|nr:adenosine deaminase-like protein [Octopus sinensis]
MDVFCSKLPKIELHAHINAAISQKTLQDVSKEKMLPVEEYQIKSAVYDCEENKNFQRLEKCFDIFKKIHEVTDNEKAIYKVTNDVIHDFCKDNVKYLELRTTPRAEISTGMTRRSYVDSVLAAIKDCKTENIDIDVRLLLSIDRKTNTDIAQEIVSIATELQQNSDGIVLGIDFSGDPKINDARDFIPVLKDAKAHGLKLAVHIAEVQNAPESQQLLLVEPDRIGHGTFLHPNVGGTQEMVELVKSKNIPIECCITSNLKSGTVASTDKHHFGFWYRQNHPVIIATDGAGIFNTYLSKEYSLVAEAFSLTKENVWELSYNSIDYIFANEDTKNKLKLKWKEIKESI